MSFKVHNENRSRQDFMEISPKLVEEFQNAISPRSSSTVPITETCLLEYTEFTHFDQGFLLQYSTDYT